MHGISDLMHARFAEMSKLGDKWIHATSLHTDAPSHASGLADERRQLRINHCDHWPRGDVFSLGHADGDSWRG